MKQSIITSKWWEIPEVKQYTHETFWRTVPTIDTNQLTHHPKFWRIEITGTWNHDLHIWYTPALIHIYAVEDWHNVASNSWIEKWNVHCIYNNWNYTEITTHVIYLHHAWVTSATLKTFWKRTRINVNSHSHDAIVYWIAYP